jgi:signal transduction histidine kinase
MNILRAVIQSKPVQLVWKLIQRYPIVTAALVIYSYYLLTSVNFFSHHSTKRTFLDYVMQFDSLFFLWIAAAALLQLQRLRRSHREEEDQRRRIERVLERQQIHSVLIRDITALLQDNVNNPLAVISVTTQEIRRKFEQDADILRWLDRIEGAMQRIHNTIRDLQAYESQKLIDSSSEAMAQEVQKS